MRQRLPIFVFLNLLSLILIFPLSSSALPSGDNAGHYDLAKMSAEIKVDAHKNDPDFLKVFNPQNRQTMINADVAEDRPSKKGMFHFYNPAALLGGGYMGTPWNAKDRISLSSLPDRETANILMSYKGILRISEGKLSNFGVISEMESAKKG